jgi:hypothetical protein
LNQIGGAVGFAEQQNMQVRVKPVLAVGDFEGADGALQPYQLAEFLSGTI